MRVLLRIWSVFSQNTIRQCIILPIRVHALTWYLWNHAVNTFFQVYLKGNSATLENTIKIFVLRFLWAQRRKRLQCVHRSFESTALSPGRFALNFTFLPFALSLMIISSSFLPEFSSSSSSSSGNSGGQPYNSISLFSLSAQAWRELLGVSQPGHQLQSQPRSDNTLHSML